MTRASSGGPSYATRPSRSTTARSIRSANGPSSWSTTHDRGAALRRGWRGSSAMRLLVRQVDPGVRLVEHEQVRLAGERARDQHPLLLAAGQRRDAGARARSARSTASSASRIATRSLATRRDERPAAREPSGGDDLGHRSRARRRRAPSAAARSRAGASRGSRSSGVPKRRMLAACASGCSPTIALTSVDLPGAVGAEQRDHLAAADGEVDVAQDRPAAERDAAPSADRSTTGGRS